MVIRLLPQSIRILENNLKACLFCPISQMSTKRIVTAPDAPAAVGPYSMGTLVGNMLYTCGCIGLDPKSGDLVSGGFEPQCRQALKNLGAILNAGGTDYKNAVKVTVLLADMAHFQVLNRIYAEYFSETPPVRTAYQVAKLPKDALVEIEAIAVVTGN